MSESLKTPQPKECQVKTETKKQKTHPHLSYAPGSLKNPAVERAIIRIIEEIECKVHLQLTILGKVVDADIEEGTWRYKVHGINFIHLLVRPDAGAPYLVSLGSRHAVRLGKAFKLYSEVLSEFRLKAPFAVIFDLVFNADGPYAQPHELAETYRYNAELLKVDDSDKTIARFIKNWTRRHDLGQCPNEEALQKFARIYDPENQDPLAQDLQGNCLRTAVMAVYVTHPEYHELAGEQPEIFDPNEVIALMAERFLTILARRHTHPEVDYMAECVERMPGVGIQDVPGITAPRGEAMEFWSPMLFDPQDYASLELVELWLEDVCPYRLITNDEPATENAPELEAISA